jgi:beta-galactosidase
VKKLGAPEHAGGANWIFSDSTSGGRVATEVARASGEVDGVRLPKEAYYVTAAMFRDDPQVHIIGHWSYPAGTKKTIYVTSNGDAVELFLNGTSLGQGKISQSYLFAFPDVAFAPGELKAVASRAGQVIATTIKRTAGPATALRITPIVDRAGLMADGADIALFDIEAIDDQGNRVPTFQQRVDFDLAGPCTWRGGYNSGKINSINHPYLDLEAGINRVAVRAARTAGKITLSARSEGLKPATIAVESLPFAGTLPALPEAKLGAAPARTIVASASTGTQTAGPAMLGKFIKTLNYTGPNASIVHVEIAARDGKNAYVNIDSPFIALPAALQGADWVQVDNRDALYSAVDLLELAVTGKTVVWIAHDNRLPRPAWLTKQFQATDSTLTVAGQPMTLFRRNVANAESLTLGANTENTSLTEGNLYLVFVNAVK